MSAYSVEIWHDFFFDVHNVKEVSQVLFPRLGAADAPKYT